MILKIYRYFRYLFVRKIQHQMMMGGPIFRPIMKGVICGTKIKDEVGNG